MSKGIEVLVAGDYCLDLIFTGLGEMPRLGREIAGTSFEMTPGGAYNSAAALHRLGVRTGWAADFGNDALSQMVLAAARDEGLDDRFFVHHARPLRKVTVALSFPEDRAFVAYYDPDPAVPAALRALPRAAPAWILVVGFITGREVEAAARLARAWGIRIAMDGNAAQARSIREPAVRRILPLLDVFLPNAAEACALAGASDLEDAGRQLGALCPVVVMKDGARGALACTPDDLVRDPALPVDPLDTTGAGDCFNAGFLCARLMGQDLATCLRWGNIVGGLSTLGNGGTGVRISRAQVEAILAGATPPGGRLSG